MNKVKVDINKLKHVSCLWIGRCSIVKMSTLFKWFTDSVQFLSKSQWHFHKNRKQSPKIHMDPQKIQNSLSNLEIEEQSWRLILPYWKATVINIVWYWYRKKTFRSVEQNREPQINPCITWPTDTAQCAKNAQWGKGTLFNKRFWENWIHI